MKKYNFLYSLIVMLTTLIASCRQKSVPEAEKKPLPCIISPGLKETIKLTTLTATTIHNELELTGSVSYDQDHVYRYQSLASGVIQKVYFNIGDYIQRGQVLAEVRTSELSSQKSDLRKAEDELKLSQRQLTATRNLHNDGVASDKDLLEAINTVTLLQGEITRIKETLQIQGGDIEKNVLIIRSPLNGYVVEKKITNGYQVDTGEDDLFVLSDLKKVWVLANVYSAQLGMVSAGQEVAIRTTAYPDKIFRGTINRLSNVFDPEERVMKAIIEISNNNLELKPSMMVSVNVYQKSTQQVVGIPSSAVIFDNNAYHVVVYHNDCDVKAVNITPVSGDKQFYYVNGGEAGVNGTIVSENQLLIYNKLKER